MRGPNGLSQSGPLKSLGCDENFKILVFFLFWRDGGGGTVESGVVKSWNGNYLRISLTFRL